MGLKTFKLRGELIILRKFVMAKKGPAKEVIEKKKSKPSSHGASTIAKQVKKLPNFVEH